MCAVRITVEIRFDPYGTNTAYSCMGYSYTYDIVYSCNCLLLRATSAAVCIRPPRSATLTGHDSTHDCLGQTDCHRTRNPPPALTLLHGLHSLFGLCGSPTSACSPACGAPRPPSALEPERPSGQTRAPVCSQAIPRLQSGQHAPCSSLTRKSLCARF